MKTLVSVFLILFVCHSYGYKPVVLLHGIGGSYSDFNDMLTYIQKYHPGTETVALDMFNGLDSMIGLHIQVPEIAKAIQKLNFPSFNLVCHSQGALICRLVLELLPNNTAVDTYVSLSGPHMGQYGVIGAMEEVYPNITTEFAYLILYDELAQDAFSAASYWNDPYHENEFLKYTWLAVMNNLTTNPFSQQYKQNFLQAKRVVLCGSPGDGVIQPWESAFFGFWDANHNLIPMEQQTIFTQDYIGLATLQNQGRLHQVQPDNVGHMEWILNESVVAKYVLPWLA